MTHNRTCRVCGETYTLDEEDVDYLFKVGMVHPFIVCRTCTYKEVKELSLELQKSLMEDVGSPVGRQRFWESICKEYGRPVTDVEELRKPRHKPMRPDG